MILVTYARLCLGEPGGHEPDLWGWRIAGDRTDYLFPFNSADDRSRFEVKAASLLPISWDGAARAWALPIILKKLHGDDADFDGYAGVLDRADLAPYGEDDGGDGEGVEKLESTIDHLYRSWVS